MFILILLAFSLFSETSSHTLLIYHNLTSSDGSILHNISNNITQLTFNGISYGNKYSVTVTAENVVGQGLGVNIEGIWRQTYESKNMFPC